MIKFTLRALPVVSLVAVASMASASLVLNPGFENNTVSGPLQGSPDFWGNSNVPGQPQVAFGNAGAYASHAQFNRPNNETLGTYFGYYSPNNPNFNETMGQWIDGLFFEEGWTYTFRSWAANGGNSNIGYGIGYRDSAGGFVLLAQQNYGGLGNPWAAYDGVTYSTAAGGPEVGRQVGIAFVSIPGVGGGGVWVDNVEFEAVPEPASMLALGAGLAAVMARRRRKS
ncbi:MAG: PEP-CTERM sorting domain-containing protein [Fimbriimonadaceae bacterium]